MRTPIRTTFAFQKEPFGRITVTPRRNCTRVIIKRRPDNSLAVSVPYGYDFHALDALLSEHSSQIANTLQPQEPQIRYHAGWTYSYPEGTAYINISSALKSRSLSIKAEGLKNDEITKKREEDKVGQGFGGAGRGGSSHTRVGGTPGKGSPGR